MPRQAGRKNRGGVWVKANTETYLKARRIAREKQTAFREAGIIDVAVSPVVIHGQYVGCVALPVNSRSTDTYSQHNPLVYRSFPEGTYICRTCNIYVKKGHICPLKQLE